MRGTKVTGSSLSNKLGMSLQRRLEQKRTNEDAGLLGLTEGGVVALPREASPLSDLLRKARVFTRPARDTSYLHVSDLVSKCLRKIALVDKLGLMHRTQNLSLTDLLTFAQGDAIHDVVRARAVAGGPGMVWGSWACKCGKSKTERPTLFSSVATTPACTSCGGSMDIYQEVPVFNKELMIVGNPDLLLYVPEHRALHVTELKSISHDAWKELARPQPDHVIQVMFYWYLMREAGYRLTDKVSVLYATKGWMFSGEPFKEFVIDAPSSVRRLDPFLEDARAVKVSRAGGSLPPRICATEIAPEAKKCEVCKTCFGMSSDEAPIKISISSALGAKPKPLRRTR